MERTMQSSSATLPICGNSSQISCPDFPNFLNPYCGPKQTKLAVLQLRDLLALGQRIGHGLAIHLREFWFVVESLQVRRAAGLIKKNDALRLGRVMQRIHNAARSALGDGGDELPV